MYYSQRGKWIQRLCPFILWWCMIFTKNYGSVKYAFINNVDSKLNQCHSVARKALQQKLLVISNSWSFRFCFGLQIKRNSNVMSCTHLLKILFPDRYIVGRPQNVCRYQRDKWKQRICALFLFNTNHTGIYLNFKQMFNEETFFFKKIASVRSKTCAKMRTVFEISISVHCFYFDVQTGRETNAISYMLFPTVSTPNRNVVSP